MALIKVTISEVDSMQGKISELSDQAERCGSTITRIKNNLDMKVSQRSNIDDMLDKSSRLLKKQAELLQAYSNILSNLTDEFLRLDRSDSVDPHIESAIEALTKLLLIPGFVTPAWKDESFLERIVEIGELLKPKPLTETFRDTIDKGEEFLENMYGKIKKATSNCVSSLKESYDSKGIVYDVVEYGKCAATIGFSLATIVGSVGTIFGTAGGSIPVAIVGIMSAGNSMINAINDAGYIYSDQYDRVGKENYLKDKLVENAGELGDMLGNEEVGETIGEAIYTGLDVVGFLSDSEEMLKAYGKVNTKITGTTGNPDIFGDLDLNDVLDVSLTSKGKLIFDSVKKTCSAFSDAWDLGSAISK